jgi:hypothetical protein
MIDARRPNTVKHNAHDFQLEKRTHVEPSTHEIHAIHAECFPKMTWFLMGLTFSLVVSRCRHYGYGDWLPLVGRTPLAPPAISQ